MIRRRATVAVLAVLLAAGSAAACGGDDDDDETGGGLSGEASGEPAQTALPHRPSNTHTDAPRRTGDTTMTTARRLLGVLLASVLVLTAACGGDDDAGGDDSPAEDGGASVEDALLVPDDHETIQAAVDAAEPGDLILVSPGVYEEAVTVETDELTIRGLDRNEVILDGGFERDNGIRVVAADGVAIENMTARNYTNNGFFLTGVQGYRGSYLTTYRIGDYGVYAFESTKGLLEHSYASGSPDARLYIGGCYPCDAVIDDVVAEFNGLGYSGTNSGGNLLIVNSTFRDNRAGIVPNSGTYEPCYPERETTIVGN